MKSIGSKIVNAALHITLYVPFILFVAQCIQKGSEMLAQIKAGSAVPPVPGQNASAN